MKNFDLSYILKDYMKIFCNKRKKYKIKINLQLI